jgi:outer membrane protein insertion porin family
MKRLWQRIYLFSLCALLAACSATKHLPEGDKLYTGARINLKGTTELTVNEHKVLKADLQGLTRPKPNTRFLGLPIKLNLYNLFYKSKKLRDRLGEPPVLLSSLDLQYNSKVLQNHSENKGFFKALVTADTVVRRKKAHAVYTIEAGNQYTINSVVFENDSSQLAKAIQASAPNTLLKVGN